MRSIKPAEQIVAPQTPPEVGEAVLRPLVSPEEAVRLWHEYLELRKRILTEDDFQYFVRYRGKDGKVKVVPAENLRAAKKLALRLNGSVEKRIVKSGVKKYDRFFGIRHLILSKRLEIGDKRILQVFHEDGTVDIREFQRPDDGHITVAYEVVAIAPNGQYTVGNGVCSSSEPGKEKSPLHVIEATALTRAKNRATMDLVGGGEVTAEEEVVEEPSPESKDDAEKAEKKATDQQLRAIFGIARQKGLSENDLKSLAQKRYGKNVKELDVQEASDLISHLQTMEVNDGRVL